MDKEKILELGYSGIMSTIDAENKTPDKNEEQRLNPWSDDLVTRLSKADFRKASGMLRRGQRIMVGFGSLPNTSKEPTPRPEAERQ